MGKLIFWIVVFFAVLMVLRLWSVHQARRERGAASRHREREVTETMVKCSRCNSYVPKSETQLAPGGYQCRNPRCNTTS